MDERPDTLDDSSASESIAYGLLRESIQQIAQEVRTLQEEVQRLKRLLCQVSHQAAVEERNRQEADALRDRQLRTFMVRISNAVNAFISQQDADDP